MTSPLVSRIDGRDYPGQVDQDLLITKRQRNSYGAAAKCSNHIVRGWRGRCRRPWPARPGRRRAARVLPFRSLHRAAARTAGCGRARRRAAARLSHRVAAEAHRVLTTRAQAGEAGHVPDELVWCGPRQCRLGGLTARHIRPSFRLSVIRLLLRGICCPAFSSADVYRYRLLTTLRLLRLAKWGRCAG
jgi:hypothetical protein